MQITLSVDSYKGVDGSSLSSTRCHQIVQVYEMLEQFGDANITYYGIQDLADKNKLFGSTNAKSAIRTFFPLLKKLDFVDYDGTFPASQCFTELGQQFVFACRALQNVTDSTPNKDLIIEKLCNIKQNAEKEGLVRMWHNPDWKNHNIWIVLKLFKELKKVHWNEYLYTLSILENGESVDYAIEQIKKDKRNIDSLEFVNEAGDILPNTCYAYLRSFLEEAGLITKVSSKESKILESADKLFTQINI